MRFLGVPELLTGPSLASPRPRARFHRRRDNVRWPAMREQMSFESAGSLTCNIGR
jgi:hypothetical protein